MLQNMRAEKAAAEAAAAAKVAAMSEPGCSAPPAAENNTKEATGHGSASVAPGFCTRQKRKLEHAPDRHDGDTVEWEAARQLLQGVITPARERAFLVANPFTVIATSYVATLQVGSRSLAYMAAHRGVHVLMSLVASARNAGGELRDVLVGARAEAPGGAGESQGGGGGGATQGV